MRWPAGKVPAGKVTDEFLTSLELVPTLLNAVGAKGSSFAKASEDKLHPSYEGVKLDGFDMLPVLRGEVKSPRKEMYWQRRGEKAARVENWKWVESGKGGGLFDLSTDLGEKKDLSGERPKVLQRMRENFVRWRREMDGAEARGPFRDY
jgi:arylsulfatase A-like enzyme